MDGSQAGVVCLPELQVEVDGGAGPVPVVDYFPYGHAGGVHAVLRGVERNVPAWHKATLKLSALFVSQRIHDCLPSIFPGWAAHVQCLVV